MLNPECDIDDIEVLTMLPHQSARLQVQNEFDYLDYKILETIKPLYLDIFSRFSFSKFKSLVKEQSSSYKQNFKTENGFIQYYGDVNKDILEYQEGIVCRLEDLKEDCKSIEGLIDLKIIKSFVKMKNKAKFKNILDVIIYLSQEIEDHCYQLKQEEKFPRILQVNQIKIDKLYFTYPKTNLELLPLGESMESCLSQYGKKIFHGEELKIIVLNDFIPYCSIGFDLTGKVIQVTLKQNMLPNIHSRNFRNIEKALTKIGLDFSDHKKYLQKEIKGNYEKTY